MRKIKFTFFRLFIYATRSTILSYFRIPPEHPSRATFDFYFEEFVPKQFLASEDDIRVISLNEPIPTREIVLVKKKGHTLPLPAKELIDMIKG